MDTGSYRQVSGFCIFGNGVLGLGELLRASSTVTTSVATSFSTVPVSGTCLKALVVVVVVVVTVVTVVTDVGSISSCSIFFSASNRRKSSSIRDGSSVGIYLYCILKAESERSALILYQIQTQPLAQVESLQKYKHKLFDGGAELTRSNRSTLRSFSQHAGKFPMIPTTINALLEIILQKKYHQ